jgi:microcystin-dependent protein
MKRLFKRNMGIVLAAFFVVGCVVSAPSVVSAQECFIGEIRMFASNFAPRNWEFCDGRLIPISENEALFSLLGTIYGGDGRTTFALPNLQGRAAIGAGQGSGLSNRRLGERGGQETIRLLDNQMPSHNHTGTVKVYSMEGESASPEDNYPAKSGAGDPDYNSSASANTTMAGDALIVGNTGGTEAHPNMPPYLAVNYIICTDGLFPPRS